MGSGALSSLRVHVEQHEQTTVVRLVGAVDIESVGSLRTRLNTLVVDGHVRLVIDLSEVGFIDSSGLGALIGVRRKVALFRGELALAAAQPAVSRVFAITSLDLVFAIFETVEEALASRSLSRLP